MRTLNPKPTFGLVSASSPIEALEIIFSFLFSFSYFFFSGASRL